MGPSPSGKLLPSGPSYLLLCRSMVVTCCRANAAASFAGFLASLLSFSSPVLDHPSAAGSSICLVLFIEAPHSALKNLSRGQWGSNRGGINTTVNKRCIRQRLAQSVRPSLISIKGACF
ncbi:hypothetical protein N658DRAFT_170043 [Parathielavia hyrcaniae]|uniref:Uncharacterized protein n=1 Tax=Parathielavia hyrcaniae TaxID=113614 RepID=A0AAN6PWR6_9PEZI|nr:hypothetical protein N658DRAFT_170043 [Parathielavia hyrcaniae]